MEVPPPPTPEQMTMMNQKASIAATIRALEQQLHDIDEKRRVLEQQLKLEEINHHRVEGALLQTRGIYKGMYGDEAPKQELKMQDVVEAGNTIFTQRGAQNAK